MTTTELNWNNVRAEVDVQRTEAIHGVIASMNEIRRAELDRNSGRAAYGDQLRADALYALYNRARRSPVVRTENDRVPVPDDLRLDVHHTVISTPWRRATICAINETPELNAVCSMIVSVKGSPSSQFSLYVCGDATVTGAVARYVDELVYGINEGIRRWWAEQPAVSGRSVSDVMRVQSAYVTQRYRSIRRALHSSFTYALSSVNVQRRLENELAHLTNYLNDLHS